MQKNISDYYSKLLETTWKKQVKNKENQQFVEDINKILENYGVEERINHTHLIRIQTDKIEDLALSYFQTTAHNNRLTKIIEKFIWNNPQTNTYLYHFTREEYAKSIQSTNSLRLYDIYKRYNDGEIKDFLKDFKIPYQIDENYKDIFYSSFTTEIPHTSDTYTINEFRHFTGQWGARLKFKVLKQDNQLRYINYHKEKFNIIHELREVIKNKYNINLIINGFTTRFAAFYVNQKYAHENEVRLYKNLLFDEDLLKKTDENNNSYIELNLDNDLLFLEEIVYEKDVEIFNIT